MDKELGNIIEDKQKFCNKLVEVLRCTEIFGHPDNNKLVELRYLRDSSDNEIVRPIFEDGTGEDGWYDINVNFDSCTAMIGDIYNQFLCKF